MAIGDGVSGERHWRRAVRTAGRPGATARLAAGAAFLRAQAAQEAAYGRPFLWLPVALAVGIAGYFALPFEPSLPVVWGLAAAAAVASRLLRDRPFPAFLALLAAFLVAGTGAATLQTRLVEAPVIDRERSVRLTGWVLERDLRGPSRVRYVVLLAGIEDLPPERTPRRVRVSSPLSGPTIAVGDGIAVAARLAPPRGAVYPGGYDSARRLFFDGIGATGFTYGAPDPVDLDGRPPFLSARAALAELRRGIAERIRLALPGTAGAIAAALLVGDRGTIPPEATEALRVAGLGHVLAISGLHMALVAGTVFAAARFVLAAVPGLAVAFPVKKAAAVAGILAGTVYLLLSGASVATQRAYVMLAISLLAVLADRPAISLRNVALAAFVVMAIDPVAVTEPGFQMSFAAVIALVAAWEAAHLARPGSLAGPGTGGAFGLALGPFAVVATLLFTSLVAGLATGPVAAFHFHRVATLGLLGNMLAMPVVTFLVMPAGVAALAAMPFGLDRPALLAMGAGLDVVVEIARAVEAATPGAGLVGRTGLSGTLLAVAGLLWLALNRARWRLFGAGLVAIGLALVPFAPRPDLLVADDGRTVAVRGPDGRLSLVLDGGGSFAASMWLKADGDGREGGGDGLSDGIACDPLGCVLPLHGRAGRGPPLVVAVSRRPSALLEDCRRADVLVTRERVVDCAGPLTVIDRAVLERTGAIAATVVRAPSGAVRLDLETALPPRRRPFHANPDVPR